jgi:hypothetical protein
MSLATNTRVQMGKRLLQDLQLAVPQFTYTQSEYTDGNGAYDAILSITDSSANPIALVAIVAKSFFGFNVVAELSSNAAVGLPETDCFFVMDTSIGSITYDSVAQMLHETFRLGAASTQIINQSAAHGFTAMQALVFPGYTIPSTPVTPSYANVTSTIANDARLGAVGA